MKKTETQTKREARSSDQDRNIGGETACETASTLYKQNMKEGCAKK